MELGAREERAFQHVIPKKYCSKRPAFALYFMPLTPKISTIPHHHHEYFLEESLLQCLIHIDCFHTYICLFWFAVRSLISSIHCWIQLYTIRCLDRISLRVSINWNILRSEPHWTRVCNFPWQTLFQINCSWLPNSHP